MKTAPHDTFKAYREETARAVERVLERLRGESRGKKRAKYAEYPFALVRAELLAPLFAKKNEAERLPPLELPPAHIAADLTLPVFALAKERKVPPQELAAELARSAGAAGAHGLIDRAEAAGGYVNVFLKRDRAYRAFLAAADRLGDRYGESDLGAGRVAVIDYSSPNVAKPIGIGHLRSTAIGEALARIYERAGFRVVRLNYLGDWGTQFGALLAAYERWGDETKTARHPIEELKKLYVRFTREAAEDPALEALARDRFQKLEQGDPALLARWKQFRDWSVEEFERAYRRLGLRFDLYLGESYFVADAPKLVRDLLKKKLCRPAEDGAVVAEPDEKGIPSFLLRKSDGASLYLTRDLAALKFRAAKFKPHILLYVVGAEQELHFKQLFWLARKARYVGEATQAAHVGFGMVLLEGKKMSTRRGTAVDLEEVLDEAAAHALAVLREKGTKAHEAELKRIAEQVGVSAVLYNDLGQSRVANIEFDWKKMLDFTGGSAVYLQYTAVRTASILRKYAESYGSFAFEAARVKFAERIEFDLAKKLGRYPDIVRDAQVRNFPHLVATYLEGVAADFNHFYAEVPVLSTKDHDLRVSRLHLIRSVGTVLRNGLRLLGIAVPEKL